MRIAVIGSGIAGLSAAWLLSRAYEVVLFEKEPRLGGHSNTIDVSENGSSVPVDTGFIVYNTACYPNLIALFDHLGVPTAPTDMSFSVSLDGGRYEYNGNGFDGYFGQRSNLVSPQHWRMIGEIRRFFADALELERSSGAHAGTLGDWLKDRGYSETFLARHIIPMGAAIWSAPLSEILSFPAVSFARFFANHGLLRMTGRPQWRTVRGGSREYVKRLTADTRAEVRKGEPVRQITRGTSGVRVETSSSTDTFDQCVVACHGDEALGLFGDASPRERALLSAFRYAENATYLHSDVRLMPVRKRVWTSWNYIGSSNQDATKPAGISYWMNKLQPLQTTRDYFVCLNPAVPPDPKQTYARFTYHHPLFDGPALAAQKQLWQLQGELKTWFCGSYFGYGFHEDAIQAGLAAAEDLDSKTACRGVRRPWRVEGESSRLTLTPATPVLEAAAE